MADNTIQGPSQFTQHAPPRRRDDSRPTRLIDGYAAGQGVDTGLMPPPRSYEPPAARNSNLGKGIVIGVAVTLVGLGGIAFGPQLLDPAPPPLQMDQLTGQQRSALHDLRSLSEISHKYGGQLERQGIIGHREATPERALQELMGGDPVFYVHSQGATPLRIDNFQQLDQLQSHVQRQEIKHQIQDGLDQLKDGLKQAGDAISRELDDFWKEVQK